MIMDRVLQDEKPDQGEEVQENETRDAIADGAQAANENNIDQQQQQSSGDSTNAQNPSEGLHQLQSNIDRLRSLIVTGDDEEDDEAMSDEQQAYDELDSKLDEISNLLDHLDEQNDNLQSQLKTLLDDIRSQN